MKDIELFREAVQCRHHLGLWTRDPDPRFREVIVTPHYLQEKQAGWRERGTSFQPEPCLWAWVQGDSNHEFLLSQIDRWKILDKADLTSRAIPGKVYREFKECRAFGNLLVEWDLALRHAWYLAAQKPEFDPAPWLARDRRLSEIAEEVSAWFAA